MGLDAAICSTFTFSLDSPEPAAYLKKFYSEGEEFLFHIKTTRNGLGYYGTDIFINVKFTIQWKQKCNKFINIKGYDVISNDGKILCDKNIFVNSNNVSVDSTITIQGRKVMFVITISPYFCLTKCPPDVPLSKNQDVVEKEPFIEKRIEQLSVDMKNLFQTGTLSDVVLTDGENKIPAHKLILARSPVFAKMFLHPMKENQENVITIKDIHITVLRVLLDYFYTGTATVKDCKMARDLYVAADKYDVKSLKEICTKLLITVDFENVLDTLLLADLYNDEKIKVAALNFIANNYYEVKALKEWCRFKAENPSLTIETLSFVLEQRK